MIVHIVCWNFKESIKKEEYDEIKGKMSEMFNNLLGKIPGLCSIKVVTEPLSSGNTDVALITEFDSVASLDAYQINPLHIEISTYVGSVVCSRKCLDYECN